MIEVRAGEEFTVRELEAMVVERGRSLRLLVLDRVETRATSAPVCARPDACGIDAVIVPQSRAARVTPAARKAATGAAETVPVHRAANLARTLAWLKAAGVWIVGADGTADRSLYESELRTPLAVVVGGEGRGLRRLTRKSCDELVAIPMHGMVASLTYRSHAASCFMSCCAGARSTGDRGPNRLRPARRGALELGQGVE